MRRALMLITLATLAGCQGRQATPGTGGDPLLGGPPIPTKGPVASADPDSIAPGVPPPPPKNGPVSPAALTQPTVPAGAITIGSPRATPARTVDGPSSSSASPAAGEWERLQARLRAAGVDWQDLKCQGGDVWHFHCAARDPRSPTIRDNFEETRPGRDGLAAIEAVLHKIEQRRVGRPSP